jgi:hypothetical protein
MRGPRRFLSCVLLLSVACTKTPSAKKLPEKLPFTFTRPAAGTSPTPAEVTAFTKKLTGFWKQVDYFRWATHLAHGLDKSFDPKMPDYALWWGQVQAIKGGDTVTFRHGDWDDNLTIEMSKLMVSVSAGYLATHDPSMRDLVVGFSKGYSAFVMAMRWGNETPDEFLWCRTPFNHNHSYTVDGRRVAVDYDPVKHRVTDWNAHTVPNETNPYWGSIWVRNERSQDDVPQILRVAPWFQRLVQDASDPDVRKAAEDALKYMTGFSNDTVTHAYVMRSKEDGQIFIPEGDLASYDYYNAVVPNAQCNAKVALAFIAKGKTLGNECGNGIQADYESIASASHYYNTAIYRYFHVAAASNALVAGQNEAALPLVQGLAARSDGMWTDSHRAGEPHWDADMAAMMLASASSGMPLTGDEARLIQTQFGEAADFYATWPYWDLWSPTVPDGTYPYTPGNVGAEGRGYVSIEEMSTFLEYCASPWHNPASVEPVDCSVVLNPSKWGQ